MGLLTLNKPSAIDALDAAIYTLQMQLAAGKESLVNANFFSTREYVLIPHHEYSPIEEGIYTRLITREDTLCDWELAYSNTVTSQDFDNYMVVGIKFQAGKGIPSHFHETDETVIILKGAVEIDNVGSVISAGTKLVIPSGHVHRFRPVEDGFGLLLLKN
jgi:quercetin dioxygenase-like cupin family protein